jgi:hypothetical protein
MPTPTGNAGFDTAAFQAEQQYQQALAVALAAYTNAGTGTSFSHDPLIVSSFPLRIARFGRRPAVDSVQGPVARQFTAAVNDAYAAAVTAASMARMQALVSAGAANGIMTINQSAALSAIAKTGRP